MAKADKFQPQTMQQNSRGEWVPAIPLPLYLDRKKRKVKCDCGEVLTGEVNYRGHYALVHILGLS